MRPIVSFCGSPTYQLSKYLTNVLKPLTDESRHKLQSTENFMNAIKTIQIPDVHNLVSFDVKSPFTSIPLQLALDCTENAIKAIPLFCTAHPLLRITLPHSRWRRFFPLARKEQKRAAFAELKLLFALIMLQIG